MAKWTLKVPENTIATIRKIFKDKKLKGKVRVINKPGKLKVKPVIQQIKDRIDRKNWKKIKKRALT